METHDEILVGFIWWLPLLLPCTHESSAWDDASLDLRQMHLHHHALLASIAVPHLGNTITGSTYFEEDLTLDVLLLRGNLKLAVLHVPRRAASQISLMLLALCVSKIGTFVGVKCQAETAFERAKVIAQDVRVLERKL